jgi:hypothetical protein
MRIQGVPSRRLSLLAAGLGFLASLVWLAPAIILNRPSLWAAGGAPFLLLGVVFYLRAKRIAAK